MSSYLERLASQIKAALPSDADPPEGADDLFLLYAILLRVKGEDTSASDVHDAWSVWMLHRNPQHQALVPYDALDEKTQLEDLPYMRAIHAVSRHLK